MPSLYKVTSHTQINWKKLDLIGGGLYKRAFANKRVVVKVGALTDGEREAIYILNDLGFGPKVYAVFEKVARSELPDDVVRGSEGTVDIVVMQRVKSRSDIHFDKEGSWWYAQADMLAAEIKKVRDDLLTWDLHGGNVGFLGKKLLAYDGVTYHPRNKA